MNLYKKVEETLASLEIPFEIIEHEPALTTEQADSFIEGIEGRCCGEFQFEPHPKAGPELWDLIRGGFEKSQSAAGPHRGGGGTGS